MKTGYPLFCNGLFIFGFLLFSLLTPMQALSHGGRLNNAGCHKDRQNQSYHCHRPAESENKDSDTRKHSNPVDDEQTFNAALARHLNGQTEVRLNYTTRDNVNGYILVDIVTKTYVIEGGLDKRSSLDSLQQAIFASTLTGKMPAVALYDTDKVVGKYEHRIIEAATSIGVKVFWVSDRRVLEIE